MKYPFMLSIFIKIADLQAHNALQHDMLRACRSASQTPQVVCADVPHQSTIKVTLSMSHFHRHIKMVTLTPQLFSQYDDTGPPHTHTV